MSRCGICGEPIGVQEPRDSRTDHATGVSYAVHRACTAAGVRRWCRENQPHSDPLTAARKESWTFTRTDNGPALNIREAADSAPYTELFNIENHPQPDRIDDE